MIKLFLTVAFVSSLLLARGQQVADLEYDPVIRDPSYTSGNGPVIFIDAAHHNFHTATGRYQPFAAVLRKDGYVVTSSSSVFTKATLDSCKILVIANSLHESNLNNWSLPSPSAFSADEITQLNDWVKNGGSIFLIADHMPFPGAVESLASSFGFKFFNGFAIKKGDDVFAPERGLQLNAITKGRNTGEHVTSIQTFTGSAFTIPDQANSILSLDKSYSVKMPKVAWQFPRETTEVITGEGLSQLAYIKYGKGRVVVSGEAAMFSAQKNGNSEMGMNRKSASQNLQLLLNIIHWLDGQFE